MLKLLDDPWICLALAVLCGVILYVDLPQNQNRLVSFCFGFHTARFLLLSAMESSK